MGLVRMPKCNRAISNNPSLAKRKNVRQVTKIMWYKIVTCWWYIIILNTIKEEPYAAVTFDVSCFPQKRRQPMVHQGTKPSPLAIAYRYMYNDERNKSNITGNTGPVLLSIRGSTGPQLTTDCCLHQYKYKVSYAFRVTCWNKTCDLVAS